MLHARSCAFLTLTHGFVSLASSLTEMGSRVGVIAREHFVRPFVFFHVLHALLCNENRLFLESLSRFIIEIVSVLIAGVGFFVRLPVALPSSSFPHFQ